MALIATHIVSVAGTPPTFAAAAAGDTVNTDATLVVKNASVSSITVTVTTPGNLATGDAFPDKEYTVAAGTEAWIPMLSAYKDPTDGKAHVAYSALPSVTRAAVRTP